jgi:hypothetical protein
LKDYSDKKTKTRKNSVAVRFFLNSGKDKKISLRKKKNLKQDKFERKIIRAI